MESLFLYPCCCLLQAGGSISSYIQFHYLLYAAGVIFSGVILIVVSIYATLSLKKRKHYYEAGIRNRLQEWISERISSESAEGHPVSKGLRHIIRNPAGRQLVIDELLISKKNFTGGAARSIVALYEQLGLKSASLEKLDSRHWHVQAHGIQELYRMDQSDTLKRIYKNINNRNELVRAEAQVGVLHMTGFDGLRFLDMVSYPLSEWQQLKLLDQLRSSGLTDSLENSIPKWLRSPTDSVVQFALKLADEYQQLALHDAVAACLKHPRAAVRSQAISTLLRIANEKTPSVLADHYSGETPHNRFAILDALQKIGTEEQFPFLSGLLEDENDSIKLNAARALALCSRQGLAMLAGLAEKELRSYEAIYRHVKSEAAL